MMWQCQQQQQQRKKITSKIPITHEQTIPEEQRLQWDLKILVCAKHRGQVAPKIHCFWCHTENFLSTLWNKKLHTNLSKKIPKKKLSQSQSKFAVADCHCEAKKKKKKIGNGKKSVFKKSLSMGKTKAPVLHQKQWIFSATCPRCLRPVVWKSKADENFYVAISVQIEELSDAEQVFWTVNGIENAHKQSWLANQSPKCLFTVPLIVTVTVTVIVTVTFFILRNSNKHFQTFKRNIKQILSCWFLLVCLSSSVCFVLCNLVCSLILSTFSFLFLSFFLSLTLSLLLYSSSLFFRAFVFCC